jgi:hypothetical protein
MVKPDGELEKVAPQRDDMRNPFELKNCSLIGEALG